MEKILIWYLLVVGCLNIPVLIYRMVADKRAEVRIGNLLGLMITWGPLTYLMVLLIKK